MLDEIGESRNTAVSQKLALVGGDPVRTRPFPSWPIHDAAEREAVLRVLETGNWWRYSYGEGVELAECPDEPRSEVAKFQQTFARHQDSKYGVAVANGTAALEIAIKALGIGPGDEVIVPAYTFVATATCILQINAVPIFADIDPDTYNLDPESFAATITPRTRAVIPVHFAGQAADLDAILPIAEKHGIAVVEDAAHTHGARLNGKGLGSFGIAGTFSFQNSKNMTAGEGGLITTDDANFAELCESYASAGRQKGRPWYEMHRLGWNYRLTEFQGAILQAQLVRLDEQNALRMQNAKYLTEQISQIEGLRPLRIDPRTDPCSHHIFIVRYDPDAFAGVPRQKFVEAMDAEGIPCSYGYTAPLYDNPMFLNKDFCPQGCPVNCPFYGRDLDYRSFRGSCPVSEKACYREAVWFEHRLLLGSKEDMDDIVTAAAKVKAHISQLSE